MITMKRLTIAAALLLLSVSYSDARLAKRTLDESCNDDTEQCPDGSFVGRDINNSCEYQECPEFKCCDWKLEPGKHANQECESGAHTCCKDGTWGCAIPGEFRILTYICQGKPTTGPFPDACPCCEPDDIPVCQLGEPQCCGENGRWQCPNNGGTEYNCGDDVFPRLDGPLCIINARDLQEINVAPGYEGGTSMPSPSPPDDEETPPEPEILRAATKPELYQAAMKPELYQAAAEVPEPSQTPPSMPTKSFKAATEYLGPPESMQGSRDYVLGRYHRCSRSRE